MKAQVPKKDVNLVHAHGFHELDGRDVAGVDKGHAGDHGAESGHVRVIRVHGRDPLVVQNSGQPAAVRSRARE